MEFKCRSKGADRLAYVPVVAGASRGLVLHYTHNNQILKSNDWMLMDAGCLYFGYCSDITRSWPLSGKFSAAQENLYKAVLNVQLGCLRALQSVPKLSFSQLNEIAAYLTAVELDRLGFRKVETNIHRWFPHSIGHHLGLDLHDCPKHNPNEPFCEGNVITVEPGVYVPFNDEDAPKEYHGLAIRIEDDILIGPDGKYVNLSDGVPKIIEEIEDLF